MVKSKSLRERKKEKTRGEIINVSRKLFSEKSFHNVSIDDIAEGTMLSRMTLYNYFKGGKDEIFFSIGKEAFKLANERLKQAISEKMSGIDQFLIICKFMFETADFMPIIYDIIREYFLRVNANNLQIEEMHDEIADSYRNGKLVEILEQFNEPYLVEFYTQLQQTAFLWIQVIENGKLDGTITSHIESAHIVHFVNLTITGIIHQSTLRKSALKRIDLKTDDILNYTLNLIRVFLTNPENVGICH